MNTNNQIVGFCYDAAGNLLAQSACPQPPPAQYPYNYDAENRLTSTAGASYTYDGDGKRVQKSSGKLYWYGMTGEILDESDATGSITDEFIFFGGKRIARRHVNADSTSTITYYFADHLGTSRIVTDASGTVLDDSDFYPFGGERAAITPTSGNNYKFTGKERDAESGLDNFGARYFSSQYGRFMSADWSVEPSPVPYADFSDPQTLNLYAYVRNNPVSRADVDGHCYPLCTVLGGAGVGAIAGAVAELGAQKLRGEKIDWRRVEKAAVAGAVTGAITGLVGPEAGLATKLGTSVAATVIGGGVERGLRHEKVLDAKEIGKDALAGGAGLIAEAQADRSFALPVIRKAVSLVTEGILDTGRRGLDPPSEPRQQQQRQQQLPLPPPPPRPVDAPPPPPPRPCLEDQCH